MKVTKLVHQAYIVMQCRATLDVDKAKQKEKKEKCAKKLIIKHSAVIPYTYAR